MEAEVLEMSSYLPKVTELVSVALGFELDSLTPKPANLNHSMTSPTLLHKWCPLMSFVSLSYFKKVLGASSQRCLDSGFQSLSLDDGLEVCDPGPP